MTQRADPVPIVIFGAGGFGREVLQVVHDINRSCLGSPPWKPMGFIVDDQFVDDRLVNGLPIVGGPAWLSDHPDVRVVLAIGSPDARYRTAKRLNGIKSSRYATLVHPKAWIGDYVNIGHGSVICAGSLITTNISIGAHVHINIGSTIGHDAVLQDFVTLNPSVNISGNVQLGEGVAIGTRSVLIPHANVGAWSVLGAGAVATKALPANVTAVGTPAKVIKTKDDGWQDVEISVHS